MTDGAGEAAALSAADAPLSPKRRKLCSRANAVRVAGWLHEVQDSDIAILRTGEPLQPFRVSVHSDPSDCIVAVVTC